MLTVVLTSGQDKQIEAAGMWPAVAEVPRASTAGCGTGYSSTG
jgi:hypothetical protein